ncbi:uncharacterized protein BXZ73DRAFT_74781 [Epithele typhae]|uniref:uncharacterized protein n=1 Tax=Epithele typhae TaxID=378194 RepID=UPI0020082488|nr:uncharacterized protein BXZ73DRAFT_74781 [Epithele typhae]KAH9942540.1 hypothetical protein BXZ73DRAFT_74781 [Epithele typhae]
MPVGHPNPRKRPEKPEFAQWNWTEKDLELLHSHKDSWKSLEEKERWNFEEKLTFTLLKAHDIPQEYPHLPAMVLQPLTSVKKTRTWLQNNTAARRKKKKKAKWNRRKPWNKLSVFIEDDEVKSSLQIWAEKTKTKGRVDLYMNEARRRLELLPSDQQDELQRKAELWEEEGPPPAVQHSQANKHGVRTMENMANYMYKQYGMILGGALFSRSPSSKKMQIHIPLLFPENMTEAALEAMKDFQAVQAKADIIFEQYQDTGLPKIQLPGPGEKPFLASHILEMGAANEGLGLPGTDVPWGLLSKEKEEIFDSGWVSENFLEKFSKVKNMDSSDVFEFLQLVAEKEDPDGTLNPQRFKLLKTFAGTYRKRVTIPANYPDIYKHLGEEPGVITISGKPNLAVKGPGVAAAGKKALKELSKLATGQEPPNPASNSSKRAERASKKEQKKKAKKLARAKKENKTSKVLYHFSSFQKLFAQ